MLAYIQHNGDVSFENWCDSSLRFVYKDTNNYPVNHNIVYYKRNCCCMFSVHVKQSRGCTRLHTAMKCSAAVYVCYNNNNIVTNWYTGYGTFTIFISYKYTKFQTSVIYDGLSLIFWHWANGH